MDEEEVINQTEQTEQSSGGAVDRVAQTAQKGKKMVDNVKKAKDIAKSAKTLSMSGPLMYILFWVFVVIVAIIIITGIVMFLVTMPGMVMENLKKIFKEVGNYVAAFFGADTTEQIEDVQIYETLDYIEDMGWDLKSEGFLTGYYDENSSEEEIKEQLTTKEKEAGFDVDEQQGVVRGDGGKIILADSDFIFTYIMSENYIYTLKNDNIVTQDSADSWWESIGKGIITGWYKIQNFFAGPLLDLFGVNKHVVSGWGKGFIGIYKENGLGIEGDPVNKGTMWNWSEIKINPETKKLSIERKRLFNMKNNAIEYSLDGWTGRYGMPLDFLLAVHKATMMPDLAFDMATSFPTEIHLLLHEASGEATAAYKTPGGNYVSWIAIQGALTGIETDEGWKWLRNFFASFKEWFSGYGAKVQAAKAAGVDVGTGEGDCTCTFTEGVGDYEGYALYEKDGKYYYVSDGPYTDEDTIGPDGNPTKKKRHEKDQLYTGSTMTVDVVEEPCERCKGIYDGIKKYIGENTDLDFITYIPYISKVTDHWYRDVYFVLPSGSTTEFVDYDYDYEALTKERWTLYETYTDNPDDGAKYNPDKVGEFILYRIDEDGYYMKDSDENLIIYEGTFDDARGNTLYVKNEKDEYVMYTGIVDENGKAFDNDGNEIKLYRKVAENEFTLYNKDETIAVAKKAITIDSSDTTALKDVGWSNSSGTWSAYEQKATSSSFEQLFKQNEIDEEENEYYKIVMKNAYINLNLNSNIIQVGEGQRTETNPTIKKMFLQNKYFRYDGSIETAEIITALRTQNTEDKADDIKYGALDENELSKTVTIDDKTYKASDYAGIVTLNQDSLNAFSMLENTHTLDSDYIYRDFKELIVELGYFEKEELTDETPRLLQFPIPAIGSANYPDRTIDKRENEFGTMIHSKHDIDANKKYTLEAILQTATNAGAGGEPEPEPEPGYAVEDRFSKSITLASSRVNNDRLQLNSSSINIEEVGAVSGGLKKPEQIPLQTFLKETEKMCKAIDKVGYNYCVRRQPGSSRQEGVACDCSETCVAGWETNLECLRFTNPGACPCQEVHCHHTVHRRKECGLQWSFKASQQNPTSQYDTCCNFLVSWALQNVGMLKEGDVLSIGTMYDWMINDLGGKEIEKGQPLKPGDILFYDDFGHVDGVLEVNGGEVILFNGGHIAETGSKKGDPLSSMSPYTGREIDHIVRLNWGNQNDGVYEGFIGNEAVVSPVTGILLDYGTYGTKPENTKDSVSGNEYRVNVDLRYGPSIKISEENSSSQGQGQGQNPTSTVKHESRIFSDKVGYARILVLNKEIFEMMDSTVSHKWRNNNDGQGLLSNAGVFAELMKTEEQLDALTDSDTGDYLSETVYGYKEFTELYEEYGIAGYILYIDGFKCELPDVALFDSDEDDDLSDEGITPNGVDLSIDDFKISTGNISGDNEKILNLYEIPEKPYNLASKKATEKLNVEELIKGDAYGAIAIDNPKTYEPLKDLDKLIFIKEGTVLGRTFVNKELVEQRLADGDDPKYNYEYYAPEEDPSAPAEEKKKNKDRLLGNYVRVIMRDENMEEIEDVETYMKLDELKGGDQEYQFREGDLEILADAIQHEGGGCGGWAKEMGATTDADKLYVSISTGYTIINKLNTDSGFKPDYNDSSKLWDASQSPLYNLLCRIPDRDDLLAKAAAYGYTTGIGKGWYAIAPDLRHRIETDSLVYCDICYEAAEFIRDHDSKHHGNNGRFGSDFPTGEPMPHTLWQQGAGYNGTSNIWLYADKNKNGIKDTESSDKGDFYLFDTVN